MKENSGLRYRGIQRKQISGGGNERQCDIDMKKLKDLWILIQ